jgi:hypothetical protein
MRKYKTFEESPAWQEAAGVYGAVLDMVEAPGCPLTAAFRAQLERASLGLGTGIAAAFHCGDRQEVLRLLSVVLAGTAEVRSLLSSVRERPRVQALSEGCGRAYDRADQCARRVATWLRVVEEGPGRESRSGEDGSGTGGERQGQDRGRPGYRGGRGGT